MYLEGLGFPSIFVTAIKERCCKVIVSTRNKSTWAYRKGVDVKIWTKLIFILSYRLLCYMSW